MLFDTFFIIDKTALQFNDRQSNAVHIDNDIGTFVLSQQGVNVTDLLGYGKVIFGKVIKVEQHHIFMV